MNRIFKRNTENKISPADQIKEDELLGRVGGQEQISDEQPSQEFKEILTEKPITAEKRDWFYINRFKDWYGDLSKKKRIAFIAGVVLLLSGSGSALAWAITRPSPATPVAAKQEVITDTPESEKIVSPLTGLKVSPELSKRPVTAVMIENSPDARPQSGLTDSGIVFEAIAEGGITRFAAVYQEDQPQYIGPVRSARPYFIDWIYAFHPAYAHAGGSAEALQKIKKMDIKDMDHGVNASAFQRVSNRVAPHNLYTSMDKLDEVKKKRGYKFEEFTGFPRKEESPSKTPNASTIEMNISSFYYNTRHVYDSKTNTYLRSEGGKPHKDGKTGKQIAPKVLIANIIPHQRHSNGVNTAYDHIGSGKCYVFQDGTVTIGTWKKESVKSMITFTDSSGKPIALNPGQTWITAVGKDSGVIYK